jgi:hypothetical protein
MIEQPIFVWLPIDQPNADLSRKRLMGWGNNMAKTCTDMLRALGSSRRRKAAPELQEKFSDFFAGDVIESRSRRYRMLVSELALPSVTR